jgi:Skp family chaperone for outer membrane proteins
MATKKNVQSTLSPELQTYLNNIAAKYQPDQEVLQRQIENAEARYPRTQQFSDIPTRLVDKLQSLILQGWRFCPSANSSVLSNAAMIAVTLHKPESVIEEELKTLRSKVSDAYHDQLFTAMEREIDELMHEAAQDAKQKAVQQAAAEEAAMRDQLRVTLGMVKA